MNALSLDLEFWQSAELLKPYVPAHAEDKLLESVEPILALLDRWNTRATFFVGGDVAAKYPDLVRDLDARGHEVASHGYSHTRLHDLGEDGFRDELRRSGDVIEGITGRRPIGFRAPSFSLDHATSWALRALREQGYRYDSSVFPMKTPLYGVAGAPRFPYKPALADITRHDATQDLWEFPVAVWKAGLRIPVGGAFYLRVLPARFVAWAIKRMNAQDQPAVLYLHPWEACCEVPRLRNASLFAQFASYWGREGVLRKLEYLLQRLNFGTMRDLLQRHACPAGASRDVLPADARRSPGDARLLW